MDKREIIVHENSHATYMIDTYSDEQVHISFHVHNDASLNCTLLIVKTSVRIILEVILCGTGAQAHIKGLYLLSETNKVSIETKQYHLEAHTTSTLNIKGIMNGNSQAQYLGTIRIEQTARNSHALQNNKNILLARNSSAMSTPILEILTDNVRCFHGSATARSDEKQLFYAMTRGMSEQHAQRLIIQAFAADVCVTEQMHNAVHHYITEL